MHFLLNNNLEENIVNQNNGRMMAQNKVDDNHLSLNESVRQNVDILIFWEHRKLW